MSGSIREMQASIVTRETKIQWDCPRCGLQNEVLYKDEGGFQHCRKCAFKVEFLIKCEIYFES